MKIILVLLLISTQSFASSCFKEKLKSLEFMHEVWDEHHETIHVYDGSGEEPVGRMTYIWNGSKKRIIVSIVILSLHYRGRGISKELYKQALKVHPDAKEIETVLTMDNLSAAVGKNREKRPKEMDEEKCKRMVANTPAVKVQNSFGFRVVSCSYAMDGIEMLLVR